MADGEAGAFAPAVPATNAPGAQPVDAPAAPTGQEQAQESVAQPRTYTEEEHKKGLETRLAKERRRLERTVRAEVENDYLRKQIETRQQPQQREPQAGEPQQKDFTDYEEYLLAKAEYRYEQKQKTTQQRQQSETAQQRDRDFAVGLAQRLHEKFEAVADEIPDIIELVRGSVPFTEPMVTYIDESDLGAKVAHFLATNVKEAARIGKLGPASQIRELDKIEAKLSAPPKASTAPSPIVPGGTNASARKGWKDMDTAEHVSAWLNRKKRR